MGSDTCTFREAWRGLCGEPCSGMYCEEHIAACSSCGEPATHECNATMGLVCGAPLCDDCEHTLCANGCNSGAPLPNGLDRHCHKGEQKYQPWYVNESEATDV